MFTSKLILPGCTSGDEQVPEQLWTYGEAQADCIPLPILSFEVNQLSFGVHAISALLATHPYKVSLKIFPSAYNSLAPLSVNIV